MGAGVSARHASPTRAVSLVGLSWARSKATGDAVAVEKGSGGDPAGVGVPRALTSPGEDDEGGFQVPLQPAVAIDEVGHVLRLGQRSCLDGQGLGETAATGGTGELRDWGGCWHGGVSPQLLSSLG